jgi:hypothetical protein
MSWDAQAGHSSTLLKEYINHLCLVLPLSHPTQRGHLSAGLQENLVKKKKKETQQGWFPRRQLVQSSFAKS